MVGVKTQWLYRSGITETKKGGNTKNKRYREDTSISSADVATNPEGISRTTGRPQRGTPTANKRPRKRTRGDDEQSPNLTRRSSRHIGRQGQDRQLAMERTNSQQRPKGSQGRDTSSLQWSAQKERPQTRTRGYDEQ